jgi:hypothetical protein
MRILAALLLCACRAVVQAPDDLSDASMPGDMAYYDLTHDIQPPDLRCSTIGPEDCSNGCDDDRNGYTDADDPACTPQVLGTFLGGSPDGLDRLLFFSTPLARTLDKNPVADSNFAEFDKRFSTMAYALSEGGSAALHLITMSPSGTGTVVDKPLGFAARDLCIFNNELIILQRSNGTTTPSAIHRRPPDGGADFPDGGIISLGITDLVTACASDGARLYVAVHDITGNPSRFRVFDDRFVEGTALAIPGGLNALNLDRCLDFAWTKNGFFGLFVDSGSYAQPLNDVKMNTTQVYPFSPGGDGGLGTPYTLDPDGGALHGIGTFRP